MCRNRTKIISERVSIIEVNFYICYDIWSFSSFCKLKPTVPYCTLNKIYQFRHPRRSFQLIYQTITPPNSHRKMMLTLVLDVVHNQLRKKRAKFKSYHNTYVKCCNVMIREITPKKSNTDTHTPPPPRTHTHTYTYTHKITNKVRNGIWIIIFLFLPWYKGTMANYKLADICNRKPCFSLSLRDFGGVAIDCMFYWSAGLWCTHVKMISNLLLPDLFTV